MIGRLTRVVITGDVLRPTNRTFKSSQHTNIRWFGSLVGRALSKATGLEVSVVNWGDGFPTEAFFAASCVECDVEGWAKLYSADSLPGESIAIVNEIFHQALVVGFELPQCFRHALSILGVPWLDFSIHPVRFLPDLIFAVRTNCTSVAEALGTKDVDEGIFEMWADIMSATAARMPTVDVGDSSVLLVAQTPGDRALILNGKILDFGDFSSEIQELYERAGPLLLKEHPYSRHDFGMSRLRMRSNYIKIVDANIYRLLASPRINHVAGLSSGVLAEAKYFNKKITSFMKPPSQSTSIGRDLSPFPTFSVQENVLSPLFWSGVLSGLLAKAQPSEHMALPSLPANSLRTSLQNFWSYNEMTTDLFVGLHRRS